MIQTSPNFYLAGFKFNFNLILTLTSMQGKAETCEFKTQFNKAWSNCATRIFGEVYYMDEVIRDVLLSGIANIRREALSMEGTMEKSITNAIAHIEAKATARNANTTVTSISSLSEYCRSNRGNQKQARRWKGNLSLFTFFSYHPFVNRDESNLYYFSKIVHA